MQLTNSTSLDVTQVMLTSCLLLGVAFFLFFFKKVAFTKGDLVKTLLGCLGLTLLSSPFYTKMFSGTGTAYHYGLPHYFFTTWESFDKSSTNTSFDLMYLLANIAFYLIVNFLVVMIFKKRTEAKKK